MSVTPGFGEFVKLTYLRNRLGLRHFFTPNTYPPFGQEALLRDVLARAAERVGSWGGHLVLVYLPSYTEVLSGRDHIYKEGLLGQLEELSIPAIDIGAAFTHEADPMSAFPRIDIYNIYGQKDNHHYNRAGYAIVAREIAMYMDRHALDGAD